MPGVDEGAGEMDIEAGLVIETILLCLVQFLISGGIAAFVVVSRMHEDKVFPRENRGSWCPRLLHRGRLHLVLSLTALEVVILPIIAIILFPILRDSLFGVEREFWMANLVPFLVIIALVAAVSVTGIGISTRNPRRFAFVSSYPLLPLYLVFRPLTGLFLRFVSLVFPDLPREFSTLFFLFPEPEEGREGFIEENGSKLMHSIVEFGVKKVREVMVPRIDIFALDIHTSLDDVRDKVARVGHSRVPVYDGRMDNIMGILYVKDLLRCSPAESGRMDLSQLMREAYFVPEGKKIDDLLREFQREKKHMAIVVDEYGGTSGIITLEDILEEIVGEIRDEYDQEAPLIRKTGTTEYTVAGRVNLGDLNDALKISLPTDEVDTLGGFVYNLMGRVPEEDEEVEYMGIRFKVNRLVGQRIAEVLLELHGKGKEDH